MESPSATLVMLLYLSWSVLLPKQIQGCSVPRIVDFENCLWSANLASSSGYNWNTRSNGATIWRRFLGGSPDHDAFSRPRAEKLDHTYFSEFGHFYGISRLPQQKDDSYSWLESPGYTIDSSTCSLSFYYQLTNHSDSISVVLVTDTSNMTIANQTTPGAGWRQGTAPIPAGITRFKIVFVSYLRTGTDGVIGVDDISFSTSCCNQFRAPFRADFECGARGFELHSDNNTRARWNMTLATFQTGRTMPGFDHTLGHIQQGHFLTVDTTTYGNQTVQLRSLPLAATTGMCQLSFWYIAGSLNNLSAWLDGIGQRRFLWNNSQIPYTGNWTKTVVSVQASSSFNLLFEAGLNSRSDRFLSLDDIAFSSSCWNFPRTLPSSSAGYGLPLDTCNWVGSDTRSPIAAGADRYTTVLVNTPTLPCTGSIESFTARTTATTIYSFYVVSVVQAGALKTYVHIKHSARVTFHGEGEQTGTMTASDGSPLLNMSFTAGDRIMFARDKSSSLDGRIVFVQGDYPYVCASTNEIAQLSKPLNGVNRIEFMTCNENYQYALRVNFKTDTPAPTTLPPTTSTSAPAVTSSTPVLTSPALPSSTASSLEGSMRGSQLPSSGGIHGTTTTTTTPPSLSPTSTTGSRTTVKPPAMASTNILPFAIAGGGLGVIFIILACVGIAAIRKRGTPVTIESSNAFAAMADAETPGNPADNPSYEELIRMQHVRTTTLQSNVDSGTLMATPNGHHHHHNGHAGTNGVNGHVHHHQHNGTNGTGGRTYTNTPPTSLEKPPAERVRSNSTDTTVMSERSSPSDTSSPHRTAGDDAVLATPPIPGESAPQPSTIKHHVYHLASDLSPAKSATASPNRQRTILVEVPGHATAANRAPLTDYQDPVEESCLEQGSEGTLTSEFRSSVRYSDPPTNIRDMYAHLSSRTYQRLQRSQVHQQTEVGKGEFGTVYAGIWQRQSGDVNVAIKVLQGETTEKERVRFLREAAIMGQFSHRNIVKLIGVVTEGDPLYIVLELMQDNVKNYLKSLRPGMPTSWEYRGESLPLHLLGMCKDVASGMAYLEHKGFIHRDLAARNVMIDSERVCKVGDFGLARDLDGGANSYYMSQGGKIPIKWTAPEAIFFRKYSSASDAWAYGVLLYEIWSLAAEPYAWWDNKETFEKVKDGFRLAPPAGCPLNMYEMMIQCWHPDPRQRPSFHEILQWLELTDQDHLLIVSPGLESQTLGETGDLSPTPSHYRVLHQKFVGHESPSPGPGDQVSAV